MEKSIAQKALEFAEQFYKGEASGHDYFHTLRVYKNAELLLKNKPDADSEVCLLAAILHDVDDRKISPLTHEGKGNARKFLRENNYDTEKIDFICKIISEVSFSENTGKPDTIESQIVQDSDRLDAIGAIGIARTFAYGGKHGREIYNPEIKPNVNQSKEQYKNSESPTINHFYEKLLLLEDLMNTPEGKSVARTRTDYIKNYLEEFFAEWNGER